MNGYRAVGLSTTLLGALLLAIAAGLVGACDKDDSIQRYEVAKTSDAPPTPAAPDAMAGSGMPAGGMPAAPGDPSSPPAASNAPITWTLPPGWTQLPGNQMRFASIAVSPAHPDLQLTVVPLGGTGGSLLSNINRWEGQIGLPHSTDTDLKTLVTRIEVAGTPVDVFDRTGAQPADHSTPKRIVAAIATHNDRTWFLKLAGPADTIQDQLANFQNFIRSIRFDAPAPTALPAGPTVASSAAGDGDAALPIAFSIPAGWQQEPAQTNSFRVVAFNFSNGTNVGETIVTHLNAGSGTMLENINRWRGQVGLDPIGDPAEAKAENLAVGDQQATIWDFNNAAAGHRMVVAMITSSQQWWFFKLAGSPALVEAQRSAFNQFMSSVRFRGAAGE